MKNVLIGLLLFGCIALAVMVAIEHYALLTQARMLESLQGEFERVKEELPAVLAQNDEEFTRLSQAIEQAGSQWIRLDDEAACRSYARIAPPLKCDIETHTIRATIETQQHSRTTTGGGQAPQQPYWRHDEKSYKVALVFAYDGRKWKPVWEKSTADDKPLESVVIGPDGPGLCEFLNGLLAAYALAFQQPAM